MQFEHFNSSVILKLKFVRNPYTRAISSYFHAIKNQVLKDELISKTGHRNIYEVSFWEFLKFLENLNLKKCDPHLGLQFLPGENNLFSYDEIIKIENFEARLHEINNKYKVNIISNNNLKKSKHHLKKLDIENSFVGNLPYFHFLSSGDQKLEIPSYKCFYNEDIKKLIDQLYKLDIEAYEYNFSDID